MAITQNVRLYHEAAYEGQIASPLAAVNCVSALNKGATSIAWGAPVVRDGAGACKAVASASTADDFLGVLVREYKFATMPGETFSLPPQQTGSVLTLGEIYVKAGQAVQAGDPVYVGTGTAVLGKFMKEAGSTTTLAVKVNAVWRTDTAEDSIGVISLRIGG